MRAQPLDAGGVEDGGENSTSSGAESIIRGVDPLCPDVLRLDAGVEARVTSLERLMSDSLCDGESLCFRAANPGCGFRRGGLMMLSGLLDRQSDLSVIGHKPSLCNYTTHRPADHVYLCGLLPPPCSTACVDKSRCQSESLGRP